MKTISVIGLGKLGLCIATVFAEHYKVIGIDNNATHLLNLKAGHNSIKESNLDLLLGVYRKNIKFCNTYHNLGDITFIVVPTPSVRGAFTSKYIENALKNIKKKQTVVIVSTVMPYETRRMQKKYPHLNLIYNPTFIALGSVLYNFTHPDFILVGTDNTKGIYNLFDIYHKICRGTNIHVLSTIEAEIAKIALNCYITMKITYANQIGNLCYRLGISAKHILEAIGTDKRIGNAYFKAGLGYGGPCFPRDNKALGVFMRKCKADSTLMDTVSSLNDLQINEFVNRIIKLNPKCVGFESLSYKKGTENIDCSQLSEIEQILHKKGIKTVIGKGDINVNWEGICQG